MTSLCSRRPVVAAADIVAGFVPPPRFAKVAFSTYLPDHNEPTQQAALDAVEDFAANRKNRGLFRRERIQPGIYLDGGYGVGKTHLLASLANAVPDSAFASFVEYTNLVGAMGFAQSVQALSEFDLVLIDEFELDDPGDTVLISTLLSELVSRGVRVGATSNTLPDRLGEGRFAADDFMREIQGLSAHFRVIRIDGPDYRHRELIEEVAPMADGELRALAAGDASGALDEATALDEHLTRVHPSAYGALLDGVSTLYLSNLRQLTHQANALRWVSLIDRLYDREVGVAYSGEWAHDLFAPDMLAGGYRKKYLRALSRLTALAAERH